MDKTTEQSPMHDCMTPQRGEARRRQVLAAASECFCQSGFHGASMDQIAKKAGMSVGHIYHYFKNKEAIIAAIVEEDLQYRLQKISTVRTGSEDGDTFASMINLIGQGLDELLHPSRTALLLECMAEATRTPAVAALVQKSDEISRARWQEVIDQGRQARGLGADPFWKVRTEVLGAVFEGLIMRSVRNPEVDRQALIDFLRRVVMQILITG